MQPSLIDAKQFYENGNYDEAARLCRVALVINPNDALAHQNLAQCLNKLNKSEEAMAEARNALELDPVLAIPHLITHYSQMHIGGA
jgi:Flp pilus assembly protein TadD